MNPIDSWYGIYGMCPGYIHGKGKLKPNDIDNMREYAIYWNAMYNQVASIYEWDISKTCDPSFLERCYIMAGHVSVYCSPDKILSIKANDFGTNVNPNGRPSQGNLYDYTGDHIEARYYLPFANGEPGLMKTADGGQASREYNAVLGIANETAFPVAALISNAARNISDVLRAEQVAIQTMKVPWLIFCDLAQKKSFVDLMEEIKKNVWLVIAANSMNKEDLQVFPNNANPAVLDAFENYKVNRENDFAYMVGLPNNPNEDKKERLLAGEMDTNNRSTNLNLEIGLRFRQRLCDDVNAAFGDIIEKPWSVKVREGVIQDVGTDDAGGSREDDTDVGDVQRD